MLVYQRVMGCSIVNHPAIGVTQLQPGIKDCRDSEPKGTAAARLSKAPYGVFHKWGTPEMDGLYGKIPLKWMI